MKFDRKGNKHDREGKFARKERKAAELRGSPDPADLHDPLADSLYGSRLRIPKASLDTLADAKKAVFDSVSSWATPDDITEIKRIRTDDFATWDHSATAESKVAAIREKAQNEPDALRYTKLALVATALPV